MPIHPIKKLRYWLEYIGLRGLSACLSILPHGLAARLAGMLAYGVGRLSRGQATALQNITIAFPDLSQKEKSKLVKACWLHLGSMLADACHMQAIEAELNKLMRLEHQDLVEQAKAQGKSLLLLSAHYGNWEVNSFFSNLLGLSPFYIYRKINNPYIDKWMRKRRGHWQGELLAKGNDTRRALVKSFQQGRDNGLMFDQHYTQGKPTLFFGKACQSASGPVELALKYDYEMILVQGWRVDRGWWRRPNFIIRFERLDRPLDKNMDNGEKAVAILNTANRALQRWIGEHPEQWFWMHKRWR